MIVESVFLIEKWIYDITPAFVQIPQIISLADNTGIYNDFNRFNSRMSMPLIITKNNNIEWRGNWITNLQNFGLEYRKEEVPAIVWEEISEPIEVPASSTTKLNSGKTAVRILNILGTQRVVWYDVQYHSIW
jgi:hypothetical protein